MTQVHAASTAVGAPSRPNAWTWASYGLALAVLLALSYSLVRMPFQVSDNIGNLLALKQRTLWDLLRDYFGGGPYLRPFLWGIMKVVFDASGGHYFAAFKAVEIAQVGTLLVLFSRLLHVRSAKELLLAPFAFVILVGMHTFGGFVWEAYPVNTYLTIAICVLAALNLSESKGGWLADAGAGVILVAAVLTVESGLLVWVALVAAYIAGARGVSKRGLAFSTALFAGYFVLRFALLGGGTPGLDERDTGYGFWVIDRFELARRFGADPSWFYFTNVASAFSSILFSEPRYGVWEFTRGLVEDNYRVAPWMTINVVTSSITTLFIVGYSLRRVLRWFRLQVEPEDRLIVVFWAVAAANAVISYAYNKDQIISVAGVLYPLAAYGVVRSLQRSEPDMNGLLRACVLGALVVASAGWTVRSVGLSYVLHLAAYRHRGDWVDVDKWMKEARVGENDPSDAEFVLRLKQEALGMHVPHPYMVYGRFASRYFDQHP